MVKIGIVILAVLSLFASSCLNTPSAVTITATQTITPPQVTITNNQTITLPPSVSYQTVTQNVTATITQPVTLPPVTNTITQTQVVTTTAIVPTTITYTPPTAAAAIQASITPYNATTFNLAEPGAHIVYFIMDYKNTANYTFTNVRFKLVFTPRELYTLSLLPFSNPIMPVDTFFLQTNVGNVCIFAMLQGVTIPANAVGQVYFALTAIVPMGGSGTGDVAYAPAQVSIV